MALAGRPVLVVSPHLDDAVLGCGQLLALSPGSVVVTVFAGSPPAGDHLTEWDAAAGFQLGDDPMARRREEDRAALGVLDARPVWLDFLDAQYQSSPTVEEIAARLEPLVRECETQRVLIPLGLFHSDHHLTHAACLAVARRYPDLNTVDRSDFDIGWIAYEEPSYRHVLGLVEERFEALRNAGVTATCVASTDGELGMAQKRRALAQYRSQLRALSTPGRPGYANAYEPERYWALRAGAGAPRRAEGLAG